MGGVTTFWLINFLFGGSIVRRDDVPWPLRVFAYLAPYGYASRSIVHSEFIHNTFTGATRKLDGSYTCEHTLQICCFGIAGEEVLNSLSKFVYNVSAKNHFLADLGYVFGLAVFFKILFVVMSYWNIS